MTSTRWQRVARVAEAHYGVVTYPQLLDCGLSRHRVTGAVSAGHLLRLHRGVYAVGHLPIDRRGHLLAATHAIGPDSCISHRAGGGYLQMLPLRRGPIDLTVPTRAGLKGRAGLVLHRARLGRDERQTVERIACTTPSRVILDLAGERPGEVEGAIKRAGSRGILDVGECLRLLERYPRRPGAPLLRRILIGEEAVAEFTRTELERRMYGLCRAAGIALPSMNVDVPGVGDVYECDCVWPKLRLIIECDSRWHDNPVASVADAKRDQGLTLAGWRVHRLRWAQIVDAPEMAARTIHHLLGEQRRLLAGREMPFLPA